MIRMQLPTVKVMLSDGSEHTVELRMSDMLRYDMVRAKNKWPVAVEAQTLAGAVAAAAALHRLGIRTGNLETILDDIAMIEADDEVDEVDPT